MSKAVLVTGAAGFIGAFLCKRLLETTDYTVVGYDNCNDYYDPGIKVDRLKMIAGAAGDESAANGLEGFECGRFVFIHADLADENAVNATFDQYKPAVVVNLAAQAGVRYSIKNPRAYVDSNLVGFFNVLEACRNHPVEHLVYAYSKLYSIPATGLRFFTVYGPMGRPDMAYFGFTNKLIKGETIKIFNMGNCKRDFTYIDDIVEGGGYYGQNRHSLNLVIANRKRLASPMGFVGGKPGSGKSFQTKREITNTRLAYPEDEIIILDPAQEFGPITEACGGRHVRLSPRLGQPPQPHGDG